MVKKTSKNGTITLSRMNFFWIRRACDYLVECLPLRAVSSQGYRLVLGLYVVSS